jgi:hypothetical protein
VIEKAYQYADPVSAAFQLYKGSIIDNAPASTEDLTSSSQPDMRNNQSNTGMTKNKWNVEALQTSYSK